MADVSNQNNCIIKKNLRAEIKGVQVKKLYHGCKG